MQTSLLCGTIFLSLDGIRRTQTKTDTVIFNKNEYRCIKLIRICSDICMNTTSECSENRSEAFMPTCTVILTGNLYTKQEFSV